MKRVLFSLLLSFTLLLTYSCNTEKNEAIEFSTEQSVNSEGLVIELDGILSKNDRLNFYSILFNNDSLKEGLNMAYNKDVK